ncbi:MAG: SUMF1/EgtB/PvdO family nonheme iron enzyme [Planctomycetota bacterium]
MTLHAADTPGVLDEPPASGRYVEHDGVYLVPHEVTIPGSDVRFAMEPIPGGMVVLSDPAGGEPTEVRLAPFWMGRCEVTWAEYKQYMKLCGVFERFEDAGIRVVTDDNLVDAITAPSKVYDPGFTYDSGDEPDLPAVSMTQYAAKQYTKWLSLLSGRFYRLPSEAEWEHACRAGSESAYCFGDDPAELDAYAWHEDNTDWATEAVGQKLANAWGLRDMHGNACEWVLDAYEPTPLADPDGPGGEPPVRWPTKLFPRVLKGGSAYLAIDEAQTTARRPSNDAEWREYDPNVPKSPWWFAYDDAQDVGFRIVAPVETPDAETRRRYWDADLPRIQKVADFRIDEEGRGERGLVDPALPAAIRSLAP